MCQGTRCLGYLLPRHIFSFTMGVSAKHVTSPGQTSMQAKMLEMPWTCTENAPGEDSKIWPSDGHPLGRGRDANLEDLEKNCTGSPVRDGVTTGTGTDRPGWVEGKGCSPMLHMRWRGLKVKKANEPDGSMVSWTLLQYHSPHPTLPPLAIPHPHLLSMQRPLIGDDHTVVTVRISHFYNSSCISFCCALTLRRWLLVRPPMQKDFTSTKWIASQR